MTKKDYILVAKALKLVHNDSGLNNEACAAVLNRVVEELGEEFARDNERYNHDLFTEFITK